jgi:hypothetical protein
MKNNQSLTVHLYDAEALERFEQAVKRAGKALRKTNNSITFNRDKATVEIRPTDELFLIEIGYQLRKIDDEAGLI